MEKPLMITSSPHLHCGETTRTVMLDVLIAMIPAVVMSVWLFGWRSLAVELVCVASCIAAEYLCCKVLKKPSTVGDLSCMVTGMLLAFNLPSTIPFWQAALGCVVAIVVAKQMFGGLGHNFVNPALLGRIVLMSSFVGEMTDWVAPRMVDTVSSATPLAALAVGDTASYSVRELLLGLHGGCLGETCAIALIMGGIYLVARRVISPIVPVTFIGTVFVLTWVLGENPVYHILSGGLMLGAIFMATDYVTSPVSKAGKFVFAIGCGLLTVVIRLYGSLPEAVSFAILLMNILTPLIERVVKPIPFGKKWGWRREG